MLRKSPPNKNSAVENHNSQDTMGGGRRNSNSSLIQGRTIALALLIVVVVFVIRHITYDDDEESYIMANSPHEGQHHVAIESGTVADVPYYHCRASASSGVYHLVLLHGAAFTKEDWKTSGILDQFCRVPHFSVSALDLDKSAGHEELKRTLDAMEAANLVRKPVSLVTPSASGKTITDWIVSGNPQDIPSYVRHWIPVAANSLSLASDAQVQSLQGLIPILAVYGDQDAGGMVTSERLGTQAGGKVVELKGRHPVYLDSPDEFVQEVTAFLK